MIAGPIGLAKELLAEVNVPFFALNSDITGADPALTRIVFVTTPIRLSENKGNALSHK